MTSERDLTAKEAASELDISVSTLYAYVSRGLIRSEPGPGHSRQRRYSVADVLALKERQAQRRDPARSAETALNWGTPVLESAITSIENGRLYYRGYDAIELATTRQFEEVIGLLWSGKLDGTEVPRADRNRQRPSGHDWPVDLGPLERFQARLPLLAESDPAAYDLRPDAITRAGGRILGALVEEVADQSSNGTIAQTFARVWNPENMNAERLIDAALIITADHELNASSFTVRCVASAGAPLYDAIGAGIGALRGVRHGGASHRTEALLAEVESPARAASTIENRLRRGEQIPGFGHNLYPDGDPRARLLVDLCHQLMPGNPALELTDAVIEAAGGLIRERPNVDFGLVVLSRALNLPAGSALTLMALGRTAGWVAHALEQYQQARIIRPRARYVGPAPLRGDGLSRSSAPSIYACASTMIAKVSPARPRNSGE